MEFTVKHFDVLDYVNQAKRLGVSQELAELQARQFEHITDVIQEQNTKLDILDKLKPATKGDVRESELRLQKEILLLKNDLQKEMKSLEIKLMSLYGGGFLIVLGLLAKGFHWL